MRVWIPSDCSVCLKDVWILLLCFKYVFRFSVQSVYKVNKVNKVNKVYKVCVQSVYKVYKESVQGVYKLCTRSVYKAGLPWYKVYKVCVQSEQGECTRCVYKVCVWPPSLLTKIKSSSLLFHRRTSFFNRIIRTFLAVSKPFHLNLSS